jgi:hypothetical protein
MVKAFDIFGHWLRRILYFFFKKCLKISFNHTIIKFLDLITVDLVHSVISVCKIKTYYVVEAHAFVILVFIGKSFSKFC